MKGKPQNDKDLNQRATQIASEIFDLINQYTHDSATAKFFLTDEINHSFYVTAGAFSSIIYTPQLESEEISDSYALSFFSVLITYGFQIYLKEHSLKTNAAPYRFADEPEYIETISRSVLEQAEAGDLTSTPLADKIIDIIGKQIEKNIDAHDFKLPDHVFQPKKLYSYVSLSLYYGYNMAAGLIEEQ